MNIEKRLMSFKKTQGLNLYFKNVDEASYDEETLKKNSFRIWRNNFIFNYEK